MPNHLNVSALVTKIQLCSHYFLDHPRIETLTFAPHSVRKCREKAVDDVFLSDFNKISCIFAYKILLQKQIYSFFC